MWGKCYRLSALVVAVVAVFVHDISSKGWIGYADTPLAEAVQASVLVQTGPTSLPRGEGRGNHSALSCRGTSVPCSMAVMGRARMGSWIAAHGGRAQRIRIFIENTQYTIDT